MEKHEAIRSFLASGAIAVAGVSRSGTKFGNTVYTELKSRGLTVYPINPNTDEIGQDLCYRDLRSVPKDVTAIVAVVKPAEAEKLVRDAYDAGIKNVWLQRGAESGAAIQFCAEHGMTCVNRECILMFAQPVGSIHKVHRFLSKLFRPGLFRSLPA